MFECRVKCVIAWATLCWLCWGGPGSGTDSDGRASAAELTQAAALLAAAQTVDVASGSIAADTAVAEQAVADAAADNAGSRDSRPPAADSATTAAPAATADVQSDGRIQLPQNPGARRHAIPPVNRYMVGLLFVYCTLIVTGSVMGGWLPTWVRLTHTRMQTIISLVGGLMLGIGVFHLLPHSTYALTNIDAAARWMMCGMLAMFLLIRTFHFHHHGPLEISPSDDSDSPVLPTGGSGLLSPVRGQGGGCHHDHDHDHDERRRQTLAAGVPSEAAGRGSGVAATLRLDAAGPPCRHAHQLSWVGIAIGLSLHTLIDGIALAASVQAESAHPTYWSLFGLGTFLAVMLHKPLDAVSITSLMAVSGWSHRSQNIVNAGFALMCPAGALVFLLGVTRLQGLQEHVVGAALAFSAGVFICISLSDLLPEMEFHAHNRGRLTAALVAGIVLAWGITFLEPPHLH